MALDPRSKNGKWTFEDIPSQTGKVAIVTGGSDGIGLEAARELARAGAHVIIAANREQKGQRAAHDIRRTTSKTKVEFEHLDTADLISVRKFAERFKARGLALDILINNAGVAGVQKRRLSPQGFEWMFAANYLGHFALTSYLMPELLRSREPRIINTASLAHRNGRINFDDLQGEENFDSNKAYGQSKLAMLMFARELQKRADTANIHLLSLPVHPGGSRTNIFTHGQQLSGAKITPKHLLMTGLVYLLGQSQQMGALPLLFAATSPNIEGGRYYGPDSFREIRGYPTVAHVAPHAKDEAVAARLWEVSEELVGFSFDLTGTRVKATDARKRTRRETTAIH